MKLQTKLNQTKLHNITQMQGLIYCIVLYDKYKQTSFILLQIVLTMTMTIKLILYKIVNSYMKHQKNSLSFITQFVKTKAENPQYIQRLRQKQFYRIKIQLLKYTNAELMLLKEVQNKKKDQLTLELNSITETQTSINYQELNIDKEIQFKILNVENQKIEYAKIQQQKIMQIQQKQKEIEHIRQKLRQSKNQRTENVKIHQNLLQQIKKQKKEIININNIKQRNNEIIKAKQLTLTQDIKTFQSKNIKRLKQIKKIKEANQSLKKINLNQLSKYETSLKQKMSSQKKMNQESRKKMIKFVEELKLIIQNPIGGTFQQKKHLVQILAQVYGYNLQKKHLSLRSSLKQKHDSVQTNISVSENQNEFIQRDSFDKKQTSIKQQTQQNIPTQILLNLIKNQFEGVDSFAQSPKKMRKIYKQSQQFCKQEQELSKKQELINKQKLQLEKLIDELKMKCIQKDNEISVYNSTLQLQNSKRK